MSLSKHIARLIWAYDADICSELASDIKAGVCGCCGVFGAVTTGKLSVIKYLISRGAAINFLNEISLWLAIDCGHLEIIKYLVFNGANIRAMSGDFIKLIFARGRPEVVEYLSMKLLDDQSR